ncbi:MAG: nicotinamide n-methyltransferase [Icmadophila ericetorum]|nr:nicotinamide n-methyltransferase [Icmadophila ericetorum]
MASSEDEEENLGSMFQEPEGYFSPEKPSTSTSYTLLSGEIIQLSLVGHDPLWGHLLWNAGQVVSTYLQKNDSLVRGKDVLELGAAAGLPSIVCGVLGAKKVLATDYPSPPLIANLAHNISQNLPLIHKHNAEVNISAQGYLWGAPLPSSIAPSSFNILILADLLFNHSCHDALICTLRFTLSRSPSSLALVFFTPYRPWLYEKDMAFFDLVREGGDMVVEKLGEWEMEKVMFEEDRGDQSVRRTVFGWGVRWTQDEQGIDTGVQRKEVEA